MRQRAWVPYGFARLDDYARERLGRSGRWVRDLAALASAIETLPDLGDALTGEDGGPALGRVAALWIGRTASASSVASWIALARRVTTRELRDTRRTARRTGSTWPGGGVGEAATEPSGPVTESSSSPSFASSTDDLEESRLVRLLVPGTVKAAFEEGLELHRAVCGHEATVGSFVEALVAESLAGDHPPDVDCVPIVPGGDPAIAEQAMARATDNWRNLPAPPNGTAALARAGIALERLDSLERQAGRGGPAELERQLREAIALEDEIERQLGRLLADMSDCGAWHRLLFNGVGHYGEQRLGLSRTTTEDRAMLARALRALPLVRDAYEQGRVGFEAALLARRVLGRGPVDSALESAWVARAAEATVKRLRDEVRELGRRGLAERVALGEPLQDKDWHASLRRAPGTALARVGRLGQAASAVGFPDVFLRLRLPGELAEGLLAAVESARRGLSTLANTVPWHDPWPDSDAPASVLAARTFSMRCRRVPAWVGLLSLIEDYVRTWDDPQQAPKRGADAIYIRAGWRCEAPGCTSRRNLEDHHLNYRSRGGGNEVFNRICLCRFHHQIGEHGELASCAGCAPLDVRWRLGREGLGGSFRNELRVA